MNTKNIDLENDKMSLSGVISLIELSNIENSENRRKTLNNIGKQAKNIEPYENTIFLNMVGYFMNCR